ncbi:MAG TPA: hypothetical protein VNY29_01160 [Terriglobales bacterium]|nr:hypothetical protein [Terriglobales bacterium]
MRDIQQRCQNSAAPINRCMGTGTGRGDAPGLNPVIRAVVKAAILNYNWKSSVCPRASTA